jgi:hypothetical protein
MNKYRSPESTIRDILRGRINSDEKTNLMSAIKKVAKKSEVIIDPEVETYSEPDQKAATISTQQNYAKRAQRKLKIIDNT